MNTTYTQKNDTVQKVANTNAESVKDSSIQNDSLQRKADMANGTAQRVHRNGLLDRKDKMNIILSDYEDYNFLKKNIEAYEQLKIDFLEKENVDKLKYMSESKFNRMFNFYYYSGGRNIFLNSRIAKSPLKDERKEVFEINADDERFFLNYLRKPKGRITVYRGSKNDKSTAFSAGGTPEISFYGVVGHQHSNTNKNGMVSTTTDENIARSYVGKKGWVYTISLDDYIDVGYVLKKRNFYNRYPDQKEILSIGDIPIKNCLKEEICAGK